MIEAWRARAKGLSCGVFRGFRAADGRFDQAEDGHQWLGFEEPNDVILWCPFNGQLASYDGRAFAINEQSIEEAATYALDDHLVIHADPRGYIMTGGKGIVVVDWRHAFYRLHQVPRIAIDESVANIYRRSMQPPRMPRVIVRGKGRVAA